MKNTKNYSFFFSKISIFKEWKGVGGIGLYLRAVTKPNWAKPTTIAEWVRTESKENWRKWGVIKAGTYAKQQNFIDIKIIFNMQILRLQDQTLL